MRLSERSSHAIGSQWERNLYFLEISIEADATSGESITAPFKLEIADIIIEARATNASGTVQVSDGTDNISDAIAMETDTTIARAGTIDDAYSTISKNGTITATTNGAADRGLVTIVCKRLG